MVKKAFPKICSIVIDSSSLEAASSWMRHRESIQSQRNPNALVNTTASCKALGKVIHGMPFLYDWIVSVVVFGRPLATPHTWLNAIYSPYSYLCSSLLKLDSCRRTLFESFPNTSKTLFGSVVDLDCRHFEWRERHVFRKSRIVERPASCRGWLEICRPRPIAKNEDCPSANVSHTRSY